LDSILTAARSSSSVSLPTEKKKTKQTVTIATWYIFLINSENKLEDFEIADFLKEEIKYLESK